MKRIWSLIIRGCWNCEWKILKESRLTVHDDAVGTRYVLQCTKCGYVIKRDLI